MKKVNLNNRNKLKPGAMSEVGSFLFLIIISARRKVVPKPAKFKTKVPPPRFTIPDLPFLYSESHG